MVKILSVCTC